MKGRGFGTDSRKGQDPETSRHREMGFKAKFVGETTQGPTTLPQINCDGYPGFDVLLTMKDRLKLVRSKLG